MPFFIMPDVKAVACVYCCYHINLTYIDIVEVHLNADTDSF